MASEPKADALSDLLLDRDLAWLEFNRRVLHEAVDDRTPLLERVKFLAIFSSNLDEFFMKRIGELKLKWEDEGNGQVAGSSAYRHLLRLREAVQALLALQADVYTNRIRPELQARGVHLLNWGELSAPQRDAASQFFRKNVFPVLTPLAVDPGHPFPFISNLSTSLGILLHHPDASERLFARVKVPDVFPQLVPLPDGAADGGVSGYCFIRLLDLIQNHLDQLFPGMVVASVMPFRITRNAVLESDDEPPENLAETVRAEILQRRFQKVVRLEYGAGGTPAQLQLLVRKLDLGDLDLYQSPAELDFTDLFAIASLNLPELRDPPWQPVVPPELEDEEADIFALIRAGDFLVHHPYESFSATVERFIRTAAEDPKVLAIKMTVYRVGADTPFLDALIRAAEAGKQVACLVEVTARFDEQQNLVMARALEKAGVHVVYGVVGLKTHSKLALVVRQDEDGLRCYAHIGTGNYHVKTARLYTDLGLFTCNPELTADVVNLFHYLTGHSRKRDYTKLLVAPVNMRQRFLELIDREIAHRQAGRPARIIAKMNQLEDPQIIAALLRASQAAVEIDLIVRGFCVLPSGLAGVSEHIRVESIIGRFLEHARIFHFRNGAAEPAAGEFYIGSADWMTRNLSSRVEAIAPVEAEPLRRRLWEILEIMLRDRRQAWDMRSDGVYTQRQPGPADFGSQQTLMDLTRQRAAAD
ncbi:MAG: polyphosphate kinase 1 [Planctomycetia bacterium]|nr:polyphosphate kinase 1 [Planctomycetia bacterium]